MLREEDDPTLVQMTSEEAAGLAHNLSRIGYIALPNAIDVALNMIADGVDSAQVTLLIVEDDE